jgi:glycosyltransferase involved in cell wall biosynthesis
MNSPAASVLMCVYNEREDFLRQALDSVLAQTMTDFELVVVDDGSVTPSTERTLTEYARRDARVRVLRKANEGLTRSLNFGLRHCQAPIVFRHDSDDWSDPARFARQRTALDEQPELVLAGSNFSFCREDGSVLWRTTLPETSSAIQASMPLGNVFCHGAVCFRREPILAMGAYRETLPCAQDYDLFWRVAERHPAINLPDHFYFLRRTNTSVTVGKTLLQDRCVAAIRELARMRAADSREDFAKAWALAGQRVETPLGRMQALLRGGDHLMLAGHYLRAIRQYTSALRAFPWSYRVYAKIMRLLLFLALPFYRRELFFPPKLPAQSSS